MKQVIYINGILLLRRKESDMTTCKQYPLQRSTAIIHCVNADKNPLPAPHLLRHFMIATVSWN
jgi:hypothetical protein